MPEEKVKNFSIQYRKELLSELENEHVSIMKHLRYLNTLVNSKESKLLPLALELFRGEMLAHVSKEILQFYVYLRNSFSRDSKEYAEVKRLRKDMDKLLYDVLRFLDDAHEASLPGAKDIAATEQKLMEDASRVVALFSQRIDIEEKILFPIYESTQQS